MRFLCILKIRVSVNNENIESDAMEKQYCVLFSVFELKIARNAYTAGPSGRTV